MAAANRSPLGFGPIFLFYLSALGVGVLFQNVYEYELVDRSLFYGFVALTVGLVIGSIGFAPVRRFYWDLFRGFKSAGVLLTLLVVSCVLGTLIIQDLDLRRDNVFDRGQPEDGSLPPFDSKNMATRYALAESHALLWIWPNEERRRMYEQKVKLTDVERQHLALRRQAFGDRAADAYEEAILASKKRGVDQLTTSNFARKHWETFFASYETVRRLRLFDIFESWWFFMLLGFIAISVIVGTIARAPWNTRDIGIAITHAGILIILTGALLDLFVAKEGYIYFTYGKPQEQIAGSIYDQKNKELHHLPFRVHLDRFATEYYHELEVAALDWSRRNDGTPWEEAEGAGSPFAVAEHFPIREGVPRVFEDGQIKVTVHAYKPRVLVRSDVVDDPEGPPNPAVKIGIYNQPNAGPNLLVRENINPWLYADDPRASKRDIRAGLGEVRFEYVRAHSEDQYRRMIEQAPVPDNGALVVRGGDEEVTLPVALGGRSALALGERSLSIEFVGIQSALADAENVNLDPRMQRSEEPVLYLRVNGRQILVPRDDRNFTKDFHLLEGLEFRFDWPDPEDRGVFQIYRVVDGGGRAPVLVMADGAGQPVVQPLAMGRRAELRANLEGYWLGLEEHVRSAKPARRVEEVTDEEFLSRGGDPRQDELLAAWADIEISGPWGSVRQELTPYDRPIRYGEIRPGQPRYVFSLVKTNSPRDWFSVLSVIDHEGERVKTHAVQVNSPLRHGGYRFFQATAGKGEQGLDVSGISVTRNPGVNFMYLGYLILTLGVCHIFFVRPILDRRRRRRRRAEQGQAA